MTTRFKVLIVVAVGALGGAIGSYTWAAYVATTENSGSSIASGTVTLSDNDSGGSLVSLSNAVPGSGDTGCIRVRYAGSLAANVRMYGTTTGSGLDRYLDVVVTRGDYSPSTPSFDSCTNFQPDATDYVGAGAGVIYSGTLENFPDGWSTGLVDPTAGAPESWGTDEVHVYRIQVTLQNDIAAEALSATQTFVWEARNL
jgi:hypothetical protein